MGSAGPRPGLSPPHHRTVPQVRVNREQRQRESWGCSRPIFKQLRSNRPPETELLIINNNDVFTKTLNTITPVRASAGV